MVSNYCQVNCRCSLGGETASNWLPLLTHNVNRTYRWRISNGCKADINAVAGALCPDGVEHLGTASSRQNICTTYHSFAESRSTLTQRNTTDSVRKIDASIPGPVKFGAGCVDGSPCVGASTCWLLTLFEAVFVIVFASKTSAGACRIGMPWTVSGE